MSVSVTMPRLGESVTEGTVTRWLKHEGDHVEADEPLLEVSTDKVDTEVPSPASGVLTSIKVQEDETVDIGVELAVIGDAAGAGFVGAGGRGASRGARARTARRHRRPSPTERRPLASPNLSERRPPKRSRNPPHQRERRPRSPPEPQEATTAPARTSAVARTSPAARHSPRSPRNPAGRASSAARAGARTPVGLGAARGRRGGRMTKRSPARTSPRWSAG